jgi:hypothetical protein
MYVMNKINDKTLKQCEEVMKTDLSDYWMKFWNSKSKQSKINFLLALKDLDDDKTFSQLNYTTITKHI